MAIVHLDENNFDKEVMKSKTPVVIDFWAAWCGPCKAFGPLFEKMSDSYTGKVKFCKLNVDEQAELASRFGIMGIPTSVFMKGGKEIDRIVGFVSEGEFKSKVDKYAK